MGFDLYGLAPHNPNNHEKPPSLDWTRTDLTEDEKNEYFKASDDYQNKVRGEYFRANVWWWRPIWSFVCRYCDDILTESDMEKGFYNDCKAISKTKADRIAKRLNKKIKDGTAAEFETNYKERAEKAKKLNDAIQEKLDLISERVKEVSKKENIVPADYPEPYKTQWDETYSKKAWDDSYPFSEKVLKDFVIFCEQSGGFEIG